MLNTIVNIIFFNIIIDWSELFLAKNELFNVLILFPFFKTSFVFAGGAGLGEHEFWIDPHFAFEADHIVS